MDFRKTSQTHTTFLNPDTSLFGNSLITFRRKSLFFKSFLKSDITKLKDIWDFQGNCFVEDRLIYTKLVDTRKWITEWSTLKTSISDCIKHNATTYNVGCKDQISLKRYYIVHENG